MDSSLLSNICLKEKGARELGLLAHNGPDLLSNWRQIIYVISLYIINFLIRKNNLMTYFSIMWILNYSYKIS